MTPGWVGRRTETGSAQLLLGAEWQPCRVIKTAFPSPNLHLTPWRGKLTSQHFLPVQKALER